MHQESKPRQILVYFWITPVYVCLIIFVIYSHFNHFAFHLRERVICELSFSCYKELVWNARLQPTTEYPMEQMEAETSQSPTGTVQSFSPTLEMLQVCPNAGFPRAQ